MKKRNKKNKRKTIDMSKQTYYLNVSHPPKDYVPKKIFRYYSISDIVTKSSFRLWVESKSLNYYCVHIEQKEFLHFIFSRNITLCSTIISFFISVYLMYSSYIDGEFMNLAYKIINTHSIEMRYSIFFFALILCVFSLMFLLLYSFFVSLFFNTSQILFEQSDEYHRMCKKYEDPSELIQFSHTQVKIIYKMRFINKNQFKTYIENRKIFLKQKNKQVNS